MRDRLGHENALLSEGADGSVQIRFVESECEVPRLPVLGFLLQQHHAVVAAGAQEQPVSRDVAQANLETEHAAVEGFCPLQVPDGDRNLVDAANGEHAQYLRVELSSRIFL